MTSQIVSFITKFLQLNVYVCVCVCVCARARKLGHFLVTNRDAILNKMFLIYIYIIYLWLYGVGHMAKDHLGYIGYLFD